MDAFYEVLRVTGNIVFVVLALVAMREWRRRPGPATAWLAASFGSLGAITLVGRLLEDAEGTLIDVVLRVLIVGIVAFPYLLWRFHITFSPVSRGWRIAAIALTAATLLAALALPALPEPGEPFTPAFQAFLFGLLVQWTLLLGAVGVRLWRSGSGQPTLARRRMRTMAVGALWLGAALLVAGTAPVADPEAGATTTQVVVQLLSIVSGPFFLLGFAPPAIVRTAWRSGEENLLRSAEAALMTAESPADVGAILLPHVSRLLGGGAAELYDEAGNLLASVAGTGTGSGGDAVEVEMVSGRLVAWASPFAPFFGEDEAELAGDLALMADLALARADLFVQLRRSNEELEQFAYVASHDLQEPLRTVASYAELLSRRYEGQLDEKADRYIDFVVDGCQRMQDLINDLLQFSRVGSRAAPLVPTDLNVPLERSLSSLEVAINEAEAEIERDPLPTVDADESQMTLVFQNLLANAIKFRGSERPKIEVRSETADGEVLVTVRDNGIGIEPQHADRIFTIFQRLHTRSEYPGTGLGLAICKKVIERHGGRIWLEDGAEHGATFRFSLPLRRIA